LYCAIIKPIYATVQKNLSFAFLRGLDYPAFSYNDRVNDRNRGKNISYRHYRAVRRVFGLFDFLSFGDSQIWRIEAFIRHLNKKKNQLSNYSWKGGENMKNLKTIGWIAFILVVIGGINWGLVGLFKLNLVATIFGESGVITRVVYMLVGLSAIYLVFAGSGKESDSKEEKRDLPVG
jgi:hypothetical protein